MTGREVLVLSVGVNLGVLLMLLAHFIGQWAGARRDRRRCQADEQLLGEAWRKAAR